MEKKLNPRMIEYSVEIKTKKELPKSGFDGVVVRLIGTRDSSNPIAINGMYTGKHQLFTVPLSDIGTIQKVFLNRIYDIEESFMPFYGFLWVLLSLVILSQWCETGQKIDWIKIQPKGANPVLLTHVIANGEQMLLMKEFKECYSAT